MWKVYGLAPGTRIEYVGETRDNRFNARMSEHKSNLTVGTSDFDVVILAENIPTRSEALAIESEFIEMYDTYHNGYNRSQRHGGGVIRHTEESRRRMSPISRERALRRLADGTHPFLTPGIQSRAGRESNRRRLADGSHHFLGGEFQREVNRRRVEEGTHPFLGGEIQRQRIEDGTHNLLPENKSYAFDRNRIIALRLSLAKKGIMALYLILIPIVFWEWLDDIHRRRKALREYPSDILDMTDAEQQSLF